MNEFITHISIEHGILGILCAGVFFIARIFFYKVKEVDVTFDNPATKMMNRFITHLFVLAIVGTVAFVGLEVIKRNDSKNIPK